MPLPSSSSGRTRAQVREAVDGTRSGVFLLSGCEIKSKRKATEMERKRVCSTLPEHLVEQIIARVPFPCMFKFRCLSRSWRDRLSSISSQTDDTKRSLATFFQREVGKWSHNWGTFCPILVSETDLIAYSRKAKRWQKMPPLAYLPDYIWGSPNLSMEGPLLYGIVHKERNTGAPLPVIVTDEVYVVNIFTKAWRQLPTRPNEGRHSFFGHKLVVESESDSYKIILTCGEIENGTEQIFVQVYESKSDTWDSMPVVLTSDSFKYIIDSTDAYLNGVQYIGVGTNPLELLAFHVTEGDWEEVFAVSINARQFNCLTVVGCSANRLMLSAEGSAFGDGYEFRHLWKADLKSRRVTEVGRYPPDDDSMCISYMNPVWDGDCVVFLRFRFRTDPTEDSSHFGHGQVLAYNVDADEWTFLTDVPPLVNGKPYGWIGTTFRPGLGPFVAV